MPPVVQKWDHDKIYSESTFIKQDMGQQNGLETHFYNSSKQVKKSTFAEKIKKH